MIDDKTRDRWNALATVDEDIRAMLAEIDRLTAENEQLRADALAERTSRAAILDIDPTGGPGPSSY